VAARSSSGIFRCRDTMENRFVKAASGAGKTTRWACRPCTGGKGKELGRVVQLERNSLLTGALNELAIKATVKGIRES